MSVTDDERREVAKRLRELPIDMYEVEERWEAEGLGTDCHDQTDYFLIHSVLFGCLPAEHMHLCDYEELHMRLADLIEPKPERTCHNVSEGGQGFTCSECGANVYGGSYRHSSVDESGVRWYTTANKPGWNYCPNCGARVTGDEK